MFSFDTKHLGKIIDSLTFSNCKILKYVFQSDITYAQQIYKFIPSAFLIVPQKYSRFRLLGHILFVTYILLYPDKLAVQFITGKCNDIFLYCYSHFVPFKQVNQLNDAPNNQNLLYYYFSKSMLAH